MVEEHRSQDDFSKKQALDNENHEEFDYSKVTDEIDGIVDYLEQLSEEAVKMRVECAIANIELVSAIDSKDFERKIVDAEKLHEDYMKQQSESNSH